MVYVTCVQLLNQWESPGSPPASKEDIDNLPLVTIAQEHIGMYSICSLHVIISFDFKMCTNVIWKCYLVQYKVQVTRKAILAKYVYNVTLINNMLMQWNENIALK